MKKYKINVKLKSQFSSVLVIFLTVSVCAHEYVRMRAIQKTLSAQRLPISISESGSRAKAQGTQADTLCPEHCR